MATTMKGIYKGFKFISQFFVVKERELEIGYPTDVKHVTHIGWDGHSGSGSAPSWMSDFTPGPGFSTSSLGNIGHERSDSNSMAASTWSSKDFDESPGRQSQNDTFKNPTIAKKQKRRKSKSTSWSSPKTLFPGSSKTGK